MASADGAVQQDGPPQATRSPDAPLPRIPRSPAVPSYADLPEEFRLRNPDKSKTKKPFARLFCFYGVGDSAAQWMHFLNEGAIWCEIAVYECKGHGTRDDEPFDVSYEERLEDAWQALRPAFAQQVPGGPAEGAPFAFFSHSAGSVMVCLIAARVRAEFGLEPTAVFVVDQPPPNVPFLNDVGYQMVCDEPFRFMSIWNPNIARMKGTNKLGDAIYERWYKGLRLLQEYNSAAQEAFHVFRCPVFVFVATAPYEQEKLFKQNVLTPEVRAHYLEHARISQGTGQDRSSSWDREQFDLWQRWTTGPCESIEVNAEHQGLWYHVDTEVKLWQEFLNLSGVADVLARQPPVRRAR